MRGTWALAIVVQSLVAGFQSSAGNTAPAASLKAVDVKPPVTRTVPSGNRVELACVRAEFMDAIVVHVGALAVKSAISAPLVGAVLLVGAPPATRILPSSYMTAQA